MAEDVFSSSQKLNEKEEKSNLCGCVKAKASDDRICQIYNSVYINVWFPLVCFNRWNRPNLCYAFVCMCKTTTTINTNRTKEKTGSAINYDYRIQIICYDEIFFLQFFLINLIIFFGHFHRSIPYKIMKIIVVCIVSSGDDLIREKKKPEKNDSVNS